jgi:hypothetical protein
LELENPLQERVGVGQVVDTKIAELLLLVTGHETSWREESMPKEIQGSGQALIGSAFLWCCKEIWLLAACRTEWKRYAIRRIVEYVHCYSGRWRILGDIQCIECKRAITYEPAHFEASTKGFVELVHRGERISEEEIVINFGQEDSNTAHFEASTKGFVELVHRGERISEEEIVINFGQEDSNTAWIIAKDK